MVDHPALVVVVRLPEHDDASKPAGLTIEVVGSARTLTLPLAAIHTAAAANVLPTTLVACALAGPVGEDWAVTPVGSGDPPAQGRIDEYRIAAMTTPVTMRLQDNLRAGRDTVVCGDQASGVSQLVAAWAQARAANGDCGLIWLSLSDATDGPESIFQTMMTMPRAEQYLLVIDGVQSNPRALERIRDCVQQLRSLNLRMVMVATAWPSLVSRLPGPFHGLRQIPANGADLVRSLLTSAGLSGSGRVAVEQLVESNVHLAVAALEQYAKDGRVPDLAALRYAVTGEMTDEALQAALYWFACLSVFEIEVPQRLAEGRFASVQIQSLVDRRLLWLSDGAYTIGSRARAGLVLQRALDEWDAAVRWGAPARIVWRHLNEAGEPTMMAMLERMDLVGLIDDPAATDGTRYLALCWERRRRLLHSLGQHYRDHGTWNDCIGADVFAAQVFAETWDLPAWRAVAAHIRTRFRYGGPALPSSVDDLTSDYTDFPAIVQAMVGEETTRELRAGHERGGEVDVDRFYRTWVLGLLLGFEGVALEPDPERLQQLLSIAAAEQDHRGGWFYPMRVPWVTARVVLGLCQAGQTYEGSEMVRRACDWLRRPVSEGGALESWWHSGTGLWNTDEATTAMCLTALHRADAPINAGMRIAMAWLVEQRAQWRRPDHEIDLALVVEALLLDGADGQDLQQGVLALLQWALDVPDNGLPQIDTEIPEDNLRLPFVVAQLTVVIRATMTRQLDVVIEHELRQYRPAVAAGALDTSVDAIPPAPGPDTFDLSEADLREWRAAGDLARGTLAEEVSDRDKASGTPSVARRQAELIEQLNEVNALCQQLSTCTPFYALRRLDQLGREVCGRRWRHPPMPPGDPS